MRAPLSDTEKQKIQAYLDAGFSICDKIDNAFTALWAMGDGQNKAVIEQLNLISDYYARLKELPRPDAAFADYLCGIIENAAAKYGTYVATFIQPLKDGQSFIQLRRDGMHISLESDRITIRMDLEEFQEIFLQHI